jgi:hypothetical protein
MLAPASVPLEVRTAAGGIAVPDAPANPDVVATEHAPGRLRTL